MLPISQKEKISFSAIKVTQPIGEFFIGSIPFLDLIQISFADVRTMINELDQYLGIQRKLSPSRVNELHKYVNTIDATFPTSVILAVPEECAFWDETNKFMTLTATSNVRFHEIAKILDGQHRIEGLKGIEDRDKSFDINVSIFVEADLAAQANIFSTVNLAQTKVNRSLAYDLLDYEKSRSPQKTSHDIAVALDKHQKSPFYERIKRLGLATSGREGKFETLTQATVVESIIKLISEDPISDRNALLKGKVLKKASNNELKKLPFRNLFLEERDTDITRIILAYFGAVKEKWPKAWEGKEKGQILPKTNGFRALMRFFSIAYVQIADNIGDVIDQESFSLKVFKNIDISESDFNTENFKPGSTGESDLLKKLIANFPSKSSSYQHNLFR